MPRPLGPRLPSLSRARVQVESRDQALILSYWTNTMEATEGTPSIVTIKSMYQPGGA